MERFAFALRALPGKRREMEERLLAASGEIDALCAKLEIGNFSLWGVEELFFGYGECPRPMESASWRILQDMAEGCGEVLCPPGSMALMYRDIGIVREDKSLIRHRVFATKLKPGCAAEYKRRHDALAAARGDAVLEGPDSNFTIWHGAGYIFGYCEKVRSFDHAMTEEEREATVAWETRQLEIMDWLTDDVDWITGEKHEAMRRVL